MKVVLQRVLEAKVVVDGEIVGSINNGLLIYLGVDREDTEKDIDDLTKRIPKIRIFEDDQGKMNQSLLDRKLEALVISQFTLCGSLRKGNRPSFNAAAPPEKAKVAYQRFVEKLSEILGQPVQTGIFAADMKVHSINDGPVTLWLEQSSNIS